VTAGLYFRMTAYGKPILACDVPVYHEHKKPAGSYPIIGVNSFRNPRSGDVPQMIELIRSTEEE
jgi:hypothetical protein